MTTDEIRKKYIDFFVSAPRNHKEIPASPLVLENDPTTLFVSAGMQPLVPYLLGEDHKSGRRLVNSQPSFRTEDIQEIGDNRHTTFFEMLGNWSLGDYFKKEQLPWFWEFLTKTLALPKEKLYVTVFQGTENVPKDEESYGIWKNLRVSEDHIFWYGEEKNWWSRSGTPEKMAIGDIGGPDSEVFYDFGTQHDPKYGKECHPNCDCGRFLEIGNSVFIQYKKERDGSLSELSKKNVDFGGGLERLSAATNNKPDIFQVDVFKTIVQSIEQVLDISYGTAEKEDRSVRVIADHIRASVQLIKAGVVPNNKMHGYVLRRIIRRAAFHTRLLDKGKSVEKLTKIASLISQTKIQQVLGQEITKFSKSLEKGLSKLQRAMKENQKINGKFAFDLYQTDGFPLDLILEILAQEGKKLSEEDMKVFRHEFEKHKELSRRVRMIKHN